MSDINELVSAVQSLNAEDAFRPRLGFEQWRVLSQYLTPHELRGGESLVRQGDADRTVYLVARGTLQMYSTGPARRVAVLRPGSIVGEAMLFLDSPHAMSVEAMTPTVVWALRMPRFEELAQRVPALAIELLRAAGATLARRLQPATPRPAAAP
ncbi:MAG TPA: cyclic nucleotide-binding domain-containing protein [Ideonella sp.]|nr:cyclic nucleotide-binding domain-containing protein [Ideonella sp.]